MARLYSVLPHAEHLHLVDYTDLPTIILLYYHGLPRSEYHGCKMRLHSGCGGLLMDKKIEKGRERLGDLSQRERDVLKLIALGLSNDEIAAKLFISPHTVKNHVSSIYRKLGIDDRTQVALIALRLGLVSLDHIDKE